MIELLISSAILITVIALLRLLCQKRVPPGLSYALWLLVLLRLTLPFPLFSSSVSVAGTVTRAIQSVQMDEPAQDLPLSQTYAESGENVLEPEKPGLAQVFGYAWLGGSVIMAIWFSAVNLKLTIRLRKSRRRLDSFAPIPIYIANGLPSPCLHGLFRPSIYLTEQAASDPQRAKIAVTHELTHWRHWDHLWSFARVLCLIVYWFDPFVWLAAWLSKQDGELFCDACSIRSLGEEHRFSYGRTLLELTEAGARPADLICGASTMSGGARRMRERIALIARRPKRSLPMVAAVVVVMLAATACTFSGSSEAIDAEAAEPAATSPPWLAPTPAPDEVAATMPPTAISEADTETTAADTPVTTQMAVDTSAPAPLQNAANTPIPQESTDQEEAAVDDTPSGGGGALPTQWVQAASGGSPSQQTLSPAETEAPADDATPPSATPPTEETESVIVRDMRDVYMNSDVEPYPDMPSTVPDSPPPTAVSDIPEG